MSVTGSKGIGIPTILFHDAEGAIVTIELKNGSIYRGQLCDTEDNMNCQLTDCTKVDENGNEAKLTRTFIRGSQIKFIVVPNILSKAPFFNRIKQWRITKGHPVYGANTNSATAKGGSSLVKGQIGQSSGAAQYGRGGSSQPGGGRINSGNADGSLGSAPVKRNDNTPAWMTNPNLISGSGTGPSTGRNDNTPAWMTGSSIVNQYQPQNQSAPQQQQSSGGHYNPQQYIPGGVRR